MEVNNNTKKGKKNKKQHEHQTTTNNNNKSKNNNKQNQNNNGSIQKKTKNRPAKKSKSWCGKIFQTLFFGTAGLACLYTLVPWVFWYFPELSNFMIFSNRFRWPPISYLNKPSEYGLNHTRNLYLSPRRNIQIGVWHVLPQSVADSNTVLNDSDFEKSLGEQKLPVILYMHGNTGTRAGWHRVQIYKLFSSMNYHTITFDYRGYAESTGVPTEDGVVEDGQFLFNWIKERVSKDTPIILWGHSLGTGVATKLAKILCDGGSPPTAVVLEAPFTNIVNATYHHPFLIPYNFFPAFKLKMSAFVQRSGIEFANDESISSVTSPIMILHAEDDFLIPASLGKKLYEIGLETRPKDSGPMKFVSFKASQKYGHKHIHSAPELAEIISSFVQTSVESGLKTPEIST